MADLDFSSYITAVAGSQQEQLSQILVPASVLELTGTDNGQHTASVQFDGSDFETPALITVAVNAGDRVLVQIDADRIARVVANISRPPNRSVEVLGAGVDKDGNDFIELVPGQDDGGNTSSAGSRLRLTNVDGSIIINGILMMGFESGAKNTTMPYITVHEALSVQNELMASWISLGNKASIRMGEVSVRRSTEASYEISIDEDTNELSIETKRCLQDSEGYFLTDDQGNWITERGETSISISPTGVKIKSPRVDINGKLYVSGEEVS